MQLSSWTTVSVLLVIAISALQVILSGAAIVVGTSSPYADERSNQALTCEPSEAVRYLRWFKSSKNQQFADAQRILELFVFANSVTFDPSVNESHYSFDASASNYPLTVNDVGLDDELRYWCDVDLDSGAIENDKTSFQVRRIPTSIRLEHVESGTSYNDGDTAKVIVGENKFECSVPNIKPAANFTWTPVPQVSTERDELNDDPRLLTSYSLATVSVSGADSQLTCSAQNKQDGTTTPDQTIRIMLETRADPCSDKPCLNGGTCSPTADDFNCTCPDAYTGDLCNDGSHERLSDGVIIGIVAGCLGGVAIIAVGSVAAWNYHKKTDVSPQTDQSKNGKDGKDKTANGKADDKPAGTADV